MKARRLLSGLLPALLLGAVLLPAQGAPVALPDAELAEVRGADGVSFAVNLNLNRQEGYANGDSRLVIGQTVEGRTTFLVLKNIGGKIDMLGLNIAAHTAEDGTNYVALTMPAYVRYTDAGFESISVQSDPYGPVSGNLGRVSLNGELQMQGQLRLWAH